MLAALLLNLPFGGIEDAKRKYILPNGITVFATPREIAGFLGENEHELRYEEPQTKYSERQLVKERRIEFVEVLVPTRVMVVDDDEEVIMALTHLI